MTRITAAELEIIARYRLRCRLDTLINAAIGYQQARNDYHKQEAVVAEDELTVAAACKLNRDDQLPTSIDLVRAAERQLEDSRRDLRRRQDVLAHRADSFFDLAADATGVLIDVMESSNFSAYRPTLLEALNQASR